MKWPGPGGLTPAVALIRHARLRAAWDFLCHSGKLLEGAPVVNAAATGLREEKAHRSGCRALAGKSARSAAANLTGPVSGRLRGLDRRKHRRAPFTKVVTAGTVVINPALHIAVIWPGGNSNHGKTGQQHAHDRPHANQAAQIPHNFPHKRSVAIRRLQLSHLITYNNYFNSRQ